MWGNTINPKPDAALRNQDTSLAMAERKKRKENPELDGWDRIWKQKMVCYDILCTDIGNHLGKKEEKNYLFINFYFAFFHSPPPSHSLRLYHRVNKTFGLLGELELKASR